MNLKNFKSGVFKQQYQYKSFTPSLINHSWVWDDPKINTLLEQATRALGELNAFSLIVPDVDLFIQMHIIKEANTSSRIEGTATTMNEAVLPKREEIAPEKRDDWEEVQNYVKAMNAAIEELKKLPLSNRLLLRTHGILMQGVRGYHKTPGEFRRSQNWIGGTSLSDAVFIPPHHEEVLELMSDLEKFWHNEEIDVPHLIRIAISHYQFETIHPFQDGNGRIGRLLITLYLVSHGLLAKPSLYLSDYFEKNKGAYYDTLTRVRTSHDLAHWIKVFLNAVIATAEKGKRTFQEILALRNEVDCQIVGMGRRAKNAQKLLTILYRRPTVNTTAVMKELKISQVSADSLLKVFVKESILQEITGFKRNRLFQFERYFRLFLK
ncbi:MAG TPA: Fic family protein [Verrucomicrobiae bacterium]|nr:Fic family protein [Verrucomicrobiae bacterium]